MSSLSKISPEFLIDQNRFLPDLSYTFSQYLITCFFTAVRHEDNNLESSVAVQELELAINFALKSLSFSHWYPGSGVVLDCINS